MGKNDLELNTKEIFEIMVENYMGIEKRIEINDDCIQAYESFKEQYMLFILPFLVFYELL